MSDFQINALLTESSVNMGDHTETVTHAIEVDPSMPVGDLCRMVLTKMPYTWSPSPWASDVEQEEPDKLLMVDTNKFLTIRLAVKP